MNGEQVLDRCTLPDRERYYPPWGWDLAIPEYSLDRDVWGTCYAPTTRGRMRLGLALLAPWLDHCRTIVEVGGGPGLHSMPLEGCATTPARRLILTDLSLTALKMAGERLGKDRETVHLGQADAVRLPFRDASVDLVICTEVLEHVADDKRAVSELFRILRPEGVAYVSVPLERRASTPWHLRCYDEKSLRNLLLSVGFSIETVVCAGVITPFLWRCVRHLCWAGWLFATGNAARQLRREVVPSFYASTFCRRAVVRLFDKIAQLDAWAALSMGCRFGTTLHSVLRRQGS